LQACVAARGGHGCRGEVFEKEVVTITRPANKAATPNKSFHYKGGVVMTTNEEIVWKNEELQKAWNKRLVTFVFFETIEEHERVKCKSCPACAARWYLAGAAESEGPAAASSAVVQPPAPPPALSPVVAETLANLNRLLRDGAHGNGRRLHGAAPRAGDLAPADYASAVVSLSQ
jgi:hypothetical protein